MWRNLLRHGVLNLPIWLEPFVIACCTLFFLFWGPGRRGVMQNLRAIKPGSTALVNFFRTYRVFWNFAWTITDNVRFAESRTIPDWEFEGAEFFEQLLALETGAIVMTAHMGSYDLGAHLFSETTSRRIVMVRAPENDPQTQQFEEQMHERTRAGGLRIDFNTGASALALDLLDAVREGHFVAIQGDRVTPGIASVRGTLFGKSIDLPSGPFALAMAARVPIFPLFVIRMGRRNYRILTCPPIHVERRSRKRDDDLEKAVGVWTAQLETVIAGAWHQWFSFEEYSPEHAA